MRRAASLLVFLGAATALAAGGRTTWAVDPSAADKKSGAARIVEATPSERRNGMEQIPLPGLNAALGMSVDEVARAYVRRRFEHLPEERWQRNGTAFRRPEVIRPMELVNEALNERLVQAEFLFEDHLLYEVRLTLADAENAAGPPKPLADTLGLRETERGLYASGDGKVVAFAGQGDAENTTWVIRRGPDAAAPREPSATEAAAPDQSRRTLREVIELRRARWAATLGPTGPYTYLIQYRCECALIGAGPVLVRVENGRAVSARSAHSGEELPERRRDDFLRTIDDLFKDLVGKTAAGADKVAVVWHPNYGYPTYASVDLDAEAIDDEFEFELVILNGNPNAGAAAPALGAQAPEVRPAARPAREPLNPGKATLVRSVGRTAVWTTRALLEHTARNRVQSFTTRYWVQEFGEGAAAADARLAHEEISTGASEALTVFPDGALLLRSGATELSWVEPGSEPAPWRLRLGGHEAVVLAAWPDGVLVQEHALNTSKPVYFAPFAAGPRRSVDLDAKVQITDEEGLPVDWMRQFERAGDRFAWLSVGLVPDPAPGGPRSVSILHVYDLGDRRRNGLTLARPVGLEIWAFDGRRALLRDSVVDVDSGAQTPAPRLSAAVTLRGPFVYHMSDHGDRYSLEATRLNDAPGPDAASKELLSVPAYPFAGMRQAQVGREGSVSRHGPDPRPTAEQLNRAAVALEDGIRVWTGKDWANVPYQDKPPHTPDEAPPKERIPAPATGRAAGDDASARGGSQSAGEARAELAAVEERIAAAERDHASLRRKADVLRVRLRQFARPDADEEAAVRTLMRREKSRIDGTEPPAAWPEDVRRAGWAWVVDIDTERLPGGYPEQIVVEVTATGGHTRQPKR